MENFQTATGEFDEKLLHKAGTMSAYHHYVLSSILPDAEKEYLCTKKKNKSLEKENELLKKKVDFMITDAEQFKAERQRIHKVIKNRENLRNQLVHCKNELSVLGKKIGIQETDLRRGHKQNEVLKEEQELVKKELQAVKQGAVNHRAEQQNLKEQLDQVIRERDGLNDKWQHCKDECSELRDKITSQQSILNRKDSQYKEQMKHLHLLKLENQKLERERGVVENDAEDQRRGLRKCEEKLSTHKEKLRESKRLRAIEDQLQKKIIIIQQRPHTALIRKPCQDVSLQKIEALQKELLTQTEELRETQKRCEELKQSLTQVAVQFQQCQATVRKQKEKFMVVTAERNMYRSQAEKLEVELANIKKKHRIEKQKNKVAKRTKKGKLSSGDKSSQSDLPSMAPRRQLKTGDKLKGPHLPSIGSKVQMQSELRIIGTKI